MVVSEDDVARTLLGGVHDGSPKPLAARIKRRLRPWFWPRIADASRWAGSTEKEGWDPRNYMRTEPRPLLKRLLETTPTNSSVLDLGCNSGADLNLLREQGFEHLHGVDAGRAALDLFMREFPETWSIAQVRHDLFQHYLQNAPDRFVDIFYTHGATVELVHPSFPIIRHVCRVTKSKVFIQICEFGHSYPRLYVRQFSRHGFHLSHREYVSTGVERQTILEFTRS